VAFKNQYQDQTVEAIEKVLREEEGVKLVHDGLSVGVPVYCIYSLPLMFYFFNRILNVRTTNWLPRAWL
jgi:hypothetical protein